ncbi:Uncharacterized conserved protein, DUF302 family [Halolactibacillus halophilus]|uniref:Uncharacterized conserved protein, DUF302 family n=1 Tax=Halolactibacillus halophilus TaxID=306540 RepID=A0A1I5NCE4_9BACI|nr:DUF302 domain-containing protein [Halolactibacillus halophilus]GEM01146.1 hypothetical protein HHA03_06780 [Halolactibacillus halophilus]SFP19046.1 Uncharacterized conserved protein, DUF302 family [Halolactibacillus halophilus]
MYHYVVTSEKSAEQLKDALYEVVPTIQFGILGELDLKAIMQKKGVDHNLSSFEFEVCNPKRAKGLIDQNPLAHMFLPCKVTIYEADGKTHIGMPRPSAQAKMLEDQKLEKMAKEIEDILIGAIDQIK